MTLKRKIQVLVVEDSADDAELILLELKRAGYDPSIQRVETEKEMRQCLDQNKWDLITSDHQMPHFSAFEAIKVWKDYDLDIPFFVISGVINNEVAIALIKAGATEFVLKDHISGLGPALDREFKEVNERREKERIGKELAASQQLYRVITENMTDSVWIMDLATQKISYINTAASKSFGYSIHEINQLTIDHLFMPESLKLMRLQMQESIKNGKINWEYESLKEFQLEYIRKDKSTFWSEDVLDVIRDSDHRPTHILGIGRDITERKKHEEELLRSRDYIWTLFENFPALIWRSGLDTKFNYFNKGWLIWTGRTLEQDLGDGWRQGVHPDDLQSFLNTYQEAFKVRGSFQIEFRLKRADGQYRWMVDIARPYNDLDGNFAGYIGSCYDVTDERQNREIILLRAEKMSKLYEITRDLNNHQDLQSLLDMVCEKTMDLMGVPQVGVSIYDPKQDALIVKSVRGYAIPIGTVIPRGIGIAGQVLGSHKPIVLNDYSSYETRLNQFKDAPFAATMTVPMIYGSELIGILGLGEFKPSTRVFGDDDLNWVSLLANAAASAIFNTELYQEVQTNADQLKMLYESGLALNSLLEPKKQLSYLLQIAQQALHCERIAFLQYSTGTGKLTYETGHGLPEGFANRLTGQEFPTEGTLLAKVLTSHNPIMYSDKELDPNSPLVDPSQRSYLLVPVIYEGKIIGILAASDSHEQKFKPTDERLMVLFSNQTSISIINARMFSEIRNRSMELEALSNISMAMRPVQKASELIPIVLTSLVELTQAKTAAYLQLLSEKGQYRIDHAYGQITPEIGYTISDKLSNTLNLNYDTPIYLHTNELEKSPYQEDWLTKSKEAIFIPLFIEQKKTGYLFLTSDNSFAENIPNILTAVSDMAANAIHRATLHEETLKRLSHLSALQTIDNAITSSTDLSFVLDILLDQIKEKLNIDAVTILLYEPTANHLEHAASRGFIYKDVIKLRLRIGESLAGKVALERKIIRVRDIEHDRNIVLVSTPHFKDEGFLEFIGHPLIVKGKLVGVLEVFHRKPLDVDDEWVSFLSGIAQLAAIAIYNARLFEDIERSNLSLISAYDSILEGWSRALELRDRTTEGHSKRVVSMTMEISLQMGIPSEKLTNIRRGALLHDIGKLGIPDSILLKPGKLTVEERKIMEEHPIFAYNLLSTIEYLNKATDIPYCHHEKWDGSGYPRNLKGEQIPIEARIFAIVDVFDALTSDRPYRKALSRENALAYIVEQSGKHFDPKVVDVFLKIINQEDKLTG